MQGHLENSVPNPDHLNKNPDHLRGSGSWHFVKSRALLIKTLNDGVIGRFALPMCGCTSLQPYNRNGSPSGSLPEDPVQHQNDPDS